MDIGSSERRTPPCGIATVFDVHAALLAEASECWANDIVSSHSCGGIAMHDMVVRFDDRGVAVEVDGGRGSYSIVFPYA